jgi:hypothetical protein
MLGYLSSYRSWIMLPLCNTRHGEEDANCLGCAVDRSVFTRHPQAIGRTHQKPPAIHDVSMGKVGHHNYSPFSHQLSPENEHLRINAGTAPGLQE